MLSADVQSLQIVAKITGLKKALQKRRYSTKETYNFKELANRSHPIGVQIHPIQASFTKKPYKRGDILQKRRIILKSLQIVATP